jgi:hypothetical protein
MECKDRTPVGPLKCWSCGRPVESPYGEIDRDGHAVCEYHAGYSRGYLDGRGDEASELVSVVAKVAGGANADRIQSDAERLLGPDEATADYAERTLTVLRAIGREEH